MTPDNRFGDDYRWDDLSHRITGRTLDGDGNPLIGCTVKLYQTLSQILVATTTSTAHGNFEFAGLSEEKEGVGSDGDYRFMGDYRWDDLSGLLIHHYIVAERDGYTSVTSDRTLVAGDHVDLTLIAVTIPVVVVEHGAGTAWHRYELYREQELRRILAEEDDEVLIICEAVLAERAA